MGASSQTASQTLTEVITWRPVLEPVLKAFEPVLSALPGLAAELADCLRASGLALPPWRSERAGQGVSLLAGEPLTGIAASMRLAAKKLLPLLGEIDAMVPHMPALEAFFYMPANGAAERYGAGDTRTALAESLVSGNREAVARIAEQAGLDALVLEFTASFVVSSVLRALTAQAGSDAGQALWEEDDLWRQGYCPVCGALPSIGWLDKPAIDEKNAFLAGGGGKKHLHCGLCGADWKFRRGACPSCGQEGNGVIEILREDGVTHGERLDWCTKCKGYCPTVDLREREFAPDLDAAALGMLHLDIVAARRKLRPLRPSFWNMF